MHRRTLLAALAAGAAGCTSSATDSHTPTTTTPTRPPETVAVLRDPPGQPGAAGTDNDWLEIAPQPGTIDRAGALAGTGAPVGHSGPYPSVVYWAPPATVAADRWVAVASHGRSEYEDAAGRIYLNRQRVARLSTWVLAHERGHNLGLRHADGGLMDYAAPDIPSDSLDTELADSTRTVAKHTEGLHLRSWGDREAALAALVAAWQRGDLTDADMQYVGAEYVAEADGEVLWSDGSLAAAVDTSPASGEVTVEAGGLYRYGNRQGDGTGAWQ